MTAAFHSCVAREERLELFLSNARDTLCAVGDGVLPAVIDAWRWAALHSEIVLRAGWRYRDVRVDDIRQLGRQIASVRIGRTRWARWERCRRAGSWQAIAARAFERSSNACA